MPEGPAPPWSGCGPRLPLLEGSCGRSVPSALLRVKSSSPKKTQWLAQEPFHTTGNAQGLPRLPESGDCCATAMLSYAEHSDCDRLSMRAFTQTPSGKGHSLRSFCCRRHEARFAAAIWRNACTSMVSTSDHSPASLTRLITFLRAHLVRPSPGMSLR